RGDSPSKKGNGTRGDEDSSPLVAPPRRGVSASHRDTVGSWVPATDLARGSTCPNAFSVPCSPSGPRLPTRPGLWTTWSTVSRHSGTACRGLTGVTRWAWLRTRFAFSVPKRCHQKLRLRRFFT